MEHPLVKGIALLTYVLTFIRVQTPYPEAQHSTAQHSSAGGKVSK
jgi:hypothetical protein